MTPETVKGILHQGGSILGTASRGNPFEFPVTDADGKVTLVDRSDEVVRNFHERGLDLLVCIGGDGSLRIASRFGAKGIPVVAVPKTIDNDLCGTVTTFGFDTAVGVATDALDRLHSTAEAHERVMVVELMGRYAGWIALNAGIAGGADVILIPEIPFSMEAVCQKIMEREASGRLFSIVAVAEGAREAGGDMRVVSKELGREQRLGGIGAYVAQEIARRTGKETRNLVLGHLQRGGRPTHFDRLLGMRFGAAAVVAAARGDRGVMVSLKPPNIDTIPLLDAVEKTKIISEDSDTVRAARAMGISLGTLPTTGDSGINIRA